MRKAVLVAIAFVVVLVGLVAWLSYAGRGPYDGPPPPGDRFLNISRSDVESVILGPAMGTDLQFDRSRARFNGTIPLALIADYLPSRMPVPSCPATPPIGGGLTVVARGDREAVYDSDCAYPPEIRRLVAAMLQAADSYHPGPSPTGA